MKRISKEESMKTRGFQRKNKRRQEDSKEDQGQ